MKKKILIILLYILQCYAVVDGKTLFGRDGNPFVLFFTAIAISTLFLSSYNRSSPLEELPVAKTRPKRLMGFLFGTMPVILLLKPIARMFYNYPDPGSASDVIPQLDALYTRWAAGIFPYYPLEQYDWHPYPVYMPLNWLPLAIPHWLHVDVRWIGIGLLLLANGVWGSYIWSKNTSIITKLIAICLPPLAVIAYMIFARFDISVSLESIIAAYYLILAAGLASKNIWVTTAGIILCLLSRYTLVFWLPIFAILLFMNRPLKISIGVWGSIVVAVFVFYLIPFYFQDPTMLSKGVTYHNNCAIAEWQGYPGSTWTFVSGIYFAPYVYQLTSGPMEHRVFIARALQALLMLAIFIWGMLYYRKKRTVMNFYDLSLATLYLVVFFFYIFSPLLYRYYYIVVLCLSAVLVGKMLTKQQPKNDAISAPVS